MHTLISVLQHKHVPLSLHSCSNVAATCVLLRICIISRSWRLLSLHSCFNVCVACCAGTDLYYKQKLTLREALTGTTFTIKHLDGRELLIKTHGMYMHMHPFVHTHSRVLALSPSRIGWLIKICARSLHMHTLTHDTRTHVHAYAHPRYMLSCANQSAYLSISQTEMSLCRRVLSH